MGRSGPFFLLLCVFNALSKETDINRLTSEPDPFNAVEAVAQAGFPIYVR